jgi:hypothetical protein
MRDHWQYACRQPITALKHGLAFEETILADSPEMISRSG